jgi:hypothetical protein
VAFITGPALATADQPDPISRIRAVLVGVSDYLYLDADLIGPANDVGLMAEMVLGRGVAPADVTILAEETAILPATVPGGVTRGLPNRETILNAFETALNASKPGDTILFYFSGHGAQAPDLDGDEGGGLDEIFLPRDAKGWNGAIGSVENAILDDEFRAFALRAGRSGVRLIAILDACHSGTGFRALPSGDKYASGARARYIAPQALNIPDDPPGYHSAPEADAASAGDKAAPKGGSAEPAPLDQDLGDFVFLYAAQSDERAFEYDFGGQWHGDFTRSLVHVLNTTANVSYQQAVAAAVEVMASRTGHIVQSPDLEGTLAESPVFGGGPAAGQMRIPVDGTRLMAGALDNLTIGSVVELFADKVSDQIAGRARVDAVRAREADIAYLEPFPKVRVTSARVADRAIDLSLQVSLTEDAARAVDHHVSGGMRALIAASDTPLITGPNGTASHILHWTGDTFVLTGADGIVDPSGPGSSPRPWRLGQGDAVTALSLGLDNALRVARLNRALNGVSKPAAGPMGLSLAGLGAGSSRGIEAGFQIEKGQARGRRCRGFGDISPVVSRARVSHCDILEITLKNPSLSRQDVTVLYIDTQSRIDVLWPRSNLSNRLDSGAEKRLKFALTHAGAGDDVSAESLIILSVPAEPGTPRVVFDALAGGASTDRGEGDPMVGALAAMIDPGGSTRSLGLGTAGSGGTGSGGTGRLTVTRLDLVIHADEME